MRATFGWPAVIIIMGSIASACVLLDVQSPLRAIVVLSFLLVCPGMAYIQLLKLHEIYAEWTLAIALSIALNILVSTVILYIGLWSIERIFLIMVAIALIGVILILVQSLSAEV